ncbi:MAG: hypothetical protein ETSY1_15235 [Candidatus Entotheonella factor]|uniref:Uncharacterized protein n=2 Tax=Candidatus Entotheonella TaxID=93171 RepID=W4LN34_ENTF1|nr:MAG: hypothetical protein ETSY1_15235 [Candidatus Entotheonella factor]
MEFNGGIASELNSQGLGPLATASAGPLINRTDGQFFDNANYPLTLAMLDIQLYQSIAGWADKLGFVINAFNVTNLQTSSFTCP